MILFPLNPNPLLAIFHLLLNSFILSLASLFLNRKLLPYYTEFRHKIYLFNFPPHPPEPPIDPDVVFDRISLFFHPHRHSLWLISLLLLLFLSYL